MSDELTETPQAAVDAAAAGWAKHRVSAEILDRVQRFAECLAVDADPVRREVAAELIEIAGVPS